MMKSFPHKHSKTSQDLKDDDCVIACGTPHDIGESRNAREDVKKGVAKREVLYLHLVVPRFLNTYAKNINLL